MKTLNTLTKKTELEIPVIESADRGKHLYGLFLDELRDIYWAERALLVLLPKASDRINSEELADAVLDDLTMNYAHIRQLESVFNSIQEKSSETRCETMAALIYEAERILETGKPGAYRDAAVVSVMKRIRYYEIASFGILCSFARTLSEIEALTLLETMLDETRESYSRLMNAAKNLLNS